MVDMGYVCAHCEGNHVSNRCPVWPQFCTNCNEDHPFGTECYKWGGVVEEEDTSEIDARIAREEEQKVLQREVRSKGEYARQKAWREANPEKYREYMREYMRKRRKRGDIQGSDQE